MCFDSRQWIEAVDGPFFVSICGPACDAVWSFITNVPVSSSGGGNLLRVSMDEYKLTVPLDAISTQLSIVAADIKRLGS